MKPYFCPALALLLVALGASATEVENGNGTIWAVLVAGSNEYYNYRHQADVCHAYQVFRRHGIPDSQIIVMMYDDIAHSSENPKKGKIFNKPIKSGGKNVYKNILKDYTKETVTAKNFIHILLGDSAAMKGIGSGKVLGSGPNDHVFVNFVDHGAAGVVGFPNDYLYADTLIRTLKKMYKKNMFKRLVFYLEACEAGSMFKDLLPSNIEVFAATASNAVESSYGCYCDSEEFSDTCLGDEFSVAWMEDIDSEDEAGDLTSETLIKQYKKVVKAVADSHPKTYGEASMKTEVVTDFFGSENSSSTVDAEKIEERFQGVVSSRDVMLHTLERRIQRANGDAKRKLQIQKRTLTKGRRTVDQLFSKILKSVSSLKGYKMKDLESSHASLSMDMMPCYRTIVDNFHENCVNINQNTYALAHLYKLANLCARKDFSEDELLEIYATECTDGHRALAKIN